MSMFIDRPWTKSYKLGPFALAETMRPFPEVPLYAFLEEAAAKHGNRSACLYQGAKLTWKELNQQVDCLTTALQELGVGHGDKVATILPTSPQFVIADYAAQKAGAAHVPCSLLHKEHELVHEIGSAGAPCP